MKTVLPVLLFLAMTGPVCADTVLIQESFDGVVGKAVSGWNGWTGDPGIVISDVVIDEGNSTISTGNVEWPAVSKKFQHKLAPREEYVLTATLNAPDSKGAYADLRLAVGDTGKAKHVGAKFGYGSLYFGQDNSIKQTISIVQSAMTMDVQLVASDEHIDCYYRNHGESAWKLGGRLKATSKIASYDTVTIVGGVVAGRSVGGGVDSVRLIVRSMGAK
jgi:hypothetical protein